MGLYQQLKNTYRSQGINQVIRDRLVDFRRSETVVKIEHPTRLDKARELGYKAKQGVVVVRVMLKKSKRQRPLIKKGRRSKHRRRKKIVELNYQAIAEHRAQKKYTNLEVLNSYYLASDAKNKWFEIILIDPSHPQILADKNLRWIATPAHKKRALRGLTSAGRRSRGLMHKGKEHIKRKSHIPSKQRVH